VATTLLIVNAGREVSEKRLKKIPAQADVINFLERKSTPLNHCVSDYIHLCQPKSKSLSVVQVGGVQPLVKSLVTSGSRKIVFSSFLIFAAEPAKFLTMAKIVHRHFGAGYTPVLQLNLC